MMERTGRRTVPQIYIDDPTSAASKTWSRSITPAGSRRCWPAKLPDGGWRRYAWPSR